MDGHENHIEHRQVLDAIMRQDFRSFLRKAMPEVSPGDRLLWNWHLDALAHELEGVWRGNTRLIVNVPPRTLKSISTSVAYVAWCLGRNPKLKFICVSYNQFLAEDLGRQCLKLMRSAWYERVFPHARIDRAKNAPGHFKTTRGGGRLATSIEGPLTGFGADFIIIDDPIKAEDGVSETERKRVNKWYDSTLNTRLNNQNTGRIILVMQRLHIDDLTGHVLEKGGRWRHLSLPAIAQADLHVSTDVDEVHAFGAGEALHPDRENLASLELRKANMGAYNFSAQYLQEPVAVAGSQPKRSRDSEADFQAL
jgi:hypothetical protein